MTDTKPHRMTFLNRLYARLRELLAAHPGVLPGRLELEVLETSALEDLNRVSKVIEACRDIGVNFALDDFGTGYSSLTYLKRLPVDVLKIDQSFVRALPDDPNSLAIIRAVAGMCGSLGIATTAEGVENDAQLEILSKEKCDSVQGWLFGKAMPIADTLGLFDRGPFARAA